MICKIIDIKSLHAEKIISFSRFAGNDGFLKFQLGKKTQACVRRPGEKQAEVIDRDDVRDRLTDIGREMIEFIISETDRLNALVTTLLNSARPRLPAFARNDIHRIIEHTVELLSAKAAGKGITLATRFDAAEPIISCDRDQLIQVFLNLIMNAIQHTPEGGRIEIATRFRSSSVEVSVCDNGPGIPCAEREKVFEPFVTRREGGIGLGLTVVQQIVLAHKGRIVAVDNLGGGACFRVYLPLKKRT